MTRSIFDPTGNNAEHSGSAFTPPDADEVSQLPEPHPEAADDEADMSSEPSKPESDNAAERA